MKINKKISKFNHTKSSIDRIKYIVIHYTGAIGTAEQSVKYFAGGDRKSSAHYFVGHKGDVWQSVEDKDIAWHCGGKIRKHKECRNSNSIGIEMCCYTKGDPKKADKNWYFTAQTVETTADLVCIIMKKYNIPISNVIRHYDVTGKICPAPFVFNTSKFTWSSFLNKIRYKLKSEPKKEAMILIQVPNQAPIYKAPGGDILRTISSGVFTITEIKDGYGLLKSKEGWISMSDVSRIR